MKRVAFTDTELQFITSFLPQMAKGMRLPRPLRRNMGRLAAKFAVSDNQVYLRPKDKAAISSILAPALIQLDADYTVLDENKEPNETTLRHKALVEQSYQKIESILEKINGQYAGALNQLLNDEGFISEAADLVESGDEPAVPTTNPDLFDRLKGIADDTNPTDIS